jgi:SUN domain-containing protein 1/2
VNPGQCWAFRGSQGYVVIQLAGIVKPTAFTLEHIPKTLSPSGKIDSAPKEFTVHGLQHDRDRDGVFIGNYTYQEAGEPLQYFPIADPDVGAFPIVEIQIHSNWGNLEYTCLYRFRVHGTLKKW